MGSSMGLSVVTGATGFLGNVLLRALAADSGTSVRALVRRETDHSAIADLDVERVEGNLADPDSLARAFADADVVFHLAGRVSITSGGLRRLREINVEGTRNVVTACREAGVRRLLYCSSIHAFVVPPRGTCITETSPVDPARSEGSYDRSKAEATLLVRNAIEQGLDAVIVYPTGVIGPYDLRPSNMGEFVLACAQGRLGAYVDGAYNFVDVRDVADGMVAAAQKGRTGEGYILAGHDVTVRELLRAVELTTGVPGPRLRLPFGLVRAVSFVIPLYYWATRQKPLFTTYSLDVISSGCAMSNEKAATDLGFNPRPLMETVEDTVRWFREQRML
jgi:nucleoside-diphosphate-sugar epimerase